MDNISQIISYTTMLIGVLVAVTNVIVEVIKKITWDRVHTNVVVVVVAVALSLACLFTLLTLTATQVQWYYAVGAVIVGFFVAYAAMFGYDKLKEILNSFITKE